MNEDLIIQEVITPKERVRSIEENMVTKDDYAKHTTLLESIATIVKDTREEQKANIAWMKPDAEPGWHAWGQDWKDRNAVTASVRKKVEESLYR